MKRVLASALLLSAISGFGVVGCSDESKVTDKETVSGPGGSTTTEVNKSVKSSGENPPPNSAGQTGKAP